MDQHAHEHDGPAPGAARPEIRPVLPVRSLDAAEELHRAMGLEVHRYDDGYAWVRAGGHEVWHLRVVPDLDPTTNPTSTYVFIDDPDAVRSRLVAAGLDPSPVAETPWGTREFEVRDPDGNHMRFGCGT